MTHKRMPGERISRSYHVMAKLHKISNQDKWMGIEEELDTRKQHLEEEDSLEVAIFKCLTIMEITQINCEEKGEQSRS